MATSLTHLSLLPAQRELSLGPIPSLGAERTQTGGSSSGQALVSPRAVRAAKFTAPDFTFIHNGKITAPLFRHILRFLDRINDGTKMNQVCKAWRYISKQCETVALNQLDLTRALEKSKNQTLLAVQRCLGWSCAKRVHTIDLWGFNLRYEEGMQHLMPALFEAYAGCQTFVAPCVGENSVTSAQSAELCRPVCESILCDLPPTLTSLNTVQLLYDTDLMFASAKPAPCLSKFSFFPLWSQDNAPERVQSVTSKLPALTELECYGLSECYEAVPSFVRFLEQCPQLKTLRLTLVKSEDPTLMQVHQPDTLYPAIEPHALREVIFTSCNVDQATLDFFTTYCKTAVLIFNNCKLPEQYRPLSPADDSKEPQKAP